MRACPVMAAVVRRPLVRRSPSEGNTTTSQGWCQAVLLSTPDGVRICTASFCTVIVVLPHLVLGLAPEVGVRMGHGHGADGVHL